MKSRPIPHDLSCFLSKTVAMTAEKELFSHWWMVMSTFVNNAPSYICMNFSFTATKSASPVNFLAVRTCTDLGVSEVIFVKLEYCSGHYL